MRPFLQLIDSAHARRCRCGPSAPVLAMAVCILRSLKKSVFSGHRPPSSTP
ncbi:hypothetical protein HMPREF0262_01084 [Clostridium sp. ATCC 29733]|nr:hypothetical protein HMPREF0262_01084 [Clostridium sp. ATCC 29733]